MIKIPTPPRKSESQQAFVSRCISFMTKNNEGNSPAQRAAVCYSMWRNRKKTKKSDAWIELTDDDLAMHDMLDDLIINGDPALRKGDAMTEQEQQEQKQFIKDGRNPTASRHNFPEVPPLPEGYAKPKTYVELLEDEVRGDVPDRMGNFYEGY